MSTSKSALNTSGNSLLNYFAHSSSIPQSKKPSASPAASPFTAKPATSKSKTKSTVKSKQASKQTKPSTSTTKKLKIEKVVNHDSDDDDDDDDDEEVVVKGKGKISCLGSDSDSDYKDDNDENESDNSQDGTKFPRKQSNGAKKKVKAKPKNKVLSAKLKQKLGKFMRLEPKIDDDDDQDEIVVPPPSITIEDTLNVLKKSLEPDQIRDAKQRRPGDPKYDSTTLFLPAEALNDLTPAHRQWWILKTRHFDTVLCFKIGKSYQLLHADADVGVRELGLTYIQGDFPHCSFPEQAFQRMATALVERGYKVARIEETETLDMMAERISKITNPTKFDKVVNREVCQVITKGTQVFGQQIAISEEYEPRYMLAIAEEASLTGHRFGVAFIDTSIGEFNIAEFKDDNQCSRLLTLLSQNQPVLLLHERGGISLTVQQIFKVMLSGAIREALVPDTQFWHAEKTLKTMSKKYFDLNNNKEWPAVIRITQDSQDHSGLTPNPKYRLALKALGGCLWYLQKCVIDAQIMDMARFNFYIPPDITDIDSNELDKSVAQIAKKTWNKHMLLDSITLSNLKIINDPKSLFTTLNKCCTQFGKRLLHKWICAPSCDRTEILERQDAIRELMENREQLDAVRAIFATLPDLERQLAQIHAFGSEKRALNHPDERAIFVDQKKLDKKKILDLVSTINGFDSLLKVTQIFSEFSSPLIKRLTQHEPKYGKLLTLLTTIFDWDKSMTSGYITKEAEYQHTQDEALCDKQNRINEELKENLKKEEKFFGCQLKYVGGEEKNRFEIEVPEKAAKKANETHRLEGQSKGKNPARRFSTNETRRMLKEIVAVEEEKRNVQKDFGRKVFELFSKEYEVWKKVVDCVSILDCLTALATYGVEQKTFCFPKIVEANESIPVADFGDCCHPCMTDTVSMDDDSLDMCQLSIFWIMAHIGAPIPGETGEFSLLDSMVVHFDDAQTVLFDCDGPTKAILYLSKTVAKENGPDSSENGIDNNHRSSGKASVYKEEATATTSGNVSSSYPHQNPPQTTPIDEDKAAVCEVSSTSGLTVSKSSNQPMAAIIRKPLQSNAKQSDPTNDAVAVNNAITAIGLKAEVEQNSDHRFGSPERSPLTSITNKRDSNVVRKRSANDNTVPGVKKARKDDSVGFGSVGSLYGFRIEHKSIPKPSIQPMEFEDVE